MKEKGLLKDFWENFEEYLCSAALLVMTFFNKDYMVQHVIYSGTGDHHVCVGLLPGRGQCV